MRASSAGSGPENFMMTVYGRIPLMQTENCIIRNIAGKCLHPEERNGKDANAPGMSRCACELIDRTGASFPVLRVDGHRNLIYNSLPTYRLDRRKELKKAGIGLCTLLFTTETEREIRTVLDCFRTSEAHPPFPITRR